MAKRLGFYLTHADLEQALQFAEKNSSIFYMCNRSNSEEKLFKIFKSFKDIDNLSVSTTGSMNLDDSYMIFTSDIEPKLETINVSGGKQRVLLDQKLNPDSVQFSPGGIFKGNVALISGQFSTLGQTEKTLELLKLLSKSVKRSSTRVKSYWLGEGAMELLSSGMRLTPDVSWPAFQNLSTEE